MSAPHINRIGRSTKRGKKWLCVSGPDDRGERLLSCTCGGSVMPLVKEGRDGKAKIVGVYCGRCIFITPLPQSFVMPQLVYGVPEGALPWRPLHLAPPNHEGDGDERPETSL
jgi:hypothetical protein